MVRRVKDSVVDRLRVRLGWLALTSYRRRGLILRTLLCWAIGLFALSTDERNYDRRFNLRGEQPASHEIILITLVPSDFFRVYDVRTNSLVNLNEITDMTDSFFWDLDTWRRLLSRVLEGSPKSVGVTLWFGDNIGSPQLGAEDRKLFQDPRVYWSTSMNNLERMLTPAFARGDLSNVGRMDLRRDDDGRVRRMAPQPGETLHLIEKVSGAPVPSDPSGLSINFRGSPRVFTRYTLNEVISGEVSTDVFSGKIVLIGADGGSGGRFQTPVGALTRSEIMAHMLDNHLENRWIRRLPFVTYATLFLLLAILAVFLITTYPQSVVLIFFLWIGTLVAALSVWAFDTLAIWFPATSPLALLIATWIVFIGYQATKVERINSALKREQRYLSELEQLKNNFVSLISHDLKTPIAKIQAIVTRLQNQNRDPALETDLRSLLISSEELNRYIQSILKVLRVESRDFKLHREVADINEVIEEALQILRPLAAEKSISLETSLEPLFSAEFDVTLIKEVVINLVENAIKYTPAGGRVLVESSESDDHIVVRINDTGQGIAPDELEKVFQKFVRGKDQDLKTKGSGLGLYLVKYFIELHGGQVKLTSELGQGSSVSFTLPLADDTTIPQSEVST